MEQERTILEVRVQPGARCDEITAINNGVLYARVKAKPHKGLANRAVLELIGKVLSVPKSQIEIVRGQTSRDKLLAVHGLSSEVVRERMEVYLKRK